MSKNYELSGSIFNDGVPTPKAYNKKIIGFEKINSKIILLISPYTWSKHSKVVLS